MRKNSSMELLRILAMYFVVMLHLVGKTMAIDEIAKDGRGYYFIWILESIF